MGFPDVCNTPAGPATVPVPYPNIGLNAQAVGFSPVVKVSGVNALNLGSMVPMTSGDEGGVAHPTIKGPATYTMGNPVVSIDRLPAINLTVPTTGNNMNNALGAVLVPSAVNVMFCRRPATPGDELESLGDAMRSCSVRAAELLPGGIGLLRVEACGPDLPSAIYAEARRMARAALRGLVLDLRGNPGGELDAALRLLEDFLPAGAVIARVLDPDGDEREILASGKVTCTLPLVLLVDGTTASAAELIAASLQENGRALVVGTRTYGKASAQRVAAMDGAARRVNAGGWRTGSGASIEGRGVVPDAYVAASSSSEDVQLEAAWALALQLAEPSSEP
jgi:carboxyl-terminal processing protease